MSQIFCNVADTTREILANYKVLLMISYFESEQTLYF